MKQLSAHELKSRMAWNQANVTARTNFVKDNNIQDGELYIHTKWNKLPQTIKDDIMKFYKPLLF